MTPGDTGGISAGSGSTPRKLCGCQKEEPAGGAAGGPAAAAAGPPGSVLPIVQCRSPAGSIEPSQRRGTARVNLSMGPLLCGGITTGLHILVLRMHSHEHGSFLSLTELNEMIKMIFTKTIIIKIPSNAMLTQKHHVAISFLAGRPF